MSARLALALCVTACLAACAGDSSGAQEESGPGEAAGCTGCTVLGECISEVTTCGGRACSACVSCNPLTCRGCCLNGRCVGESRDTACGAGGSPCSVCRAGTVCSQGACGIPPGRGCSDSSQCSSGLECLLARDGEFDTRTGQRIESYQTTRCWQPCESGAPCAAGFECVDSSMRGKRACVPLREASSRWALRRRSYIAPPTFTGVPSEELQVCVLAGGATFCDRTIPYGVPMGPFWDRDFAHVFTEDELARLEVEIWRLPPNEGTPRCEGDCSALAPLHTQLASRTPVPVDVRPPPLVRHWTQKLLLKQGPNGGPTSVTLQLELLP